MLVIQRRRRQRRYVIGGGLVDWIPSITRAIGAAGRFLSSNRENIKNVADVTGSIAKAGTSTVSAVKQIIDAVRSKRPTGASHPAGKVLSEKSLEILSQMAHAPVGVQVPILAVG
jgi:hypothetical protein